MRNVAYVIHIVNVHSLMLCKKKCSFRIRKEIYIWGFSSLPLSIVCTSLSFHVQCTAAELLVKHNLWSKWYCKSCEEWFNKSCSNTVPIIQSFILETCVNILLFVCKTQLWKKERERNIYKFLFCWLLISKGCLNCSHLIFFWCVICPETISWRMRNLQIEK